MSRTYKPVRRGSRRFDHSCRNHGSCTWCLGNRTHRHRKQAAKADAGVAAATGPSNRAMTAEGPQ